MRRAGSGSSAGGPRPWGGARGVGSSASIASLDHPTSRSSARRLHCDRARLRALRLLLDLFTPPPRASTCSSGPGQRSDSASNPAPRAPSLAGVALLTALRELGERAVVRDRLRELLSNPFQEARLCALGFTGRATARSGRRDPAAAEATTVLREVPKPYRERVRGAEHGSGCLPDASRGPAVHLNGRKGALRTRPRRREATRTPS